MGTIHHLLRPDERFVLECFGELARFRESYDSHVLSEIRARLAPRFGPQSEAVLSQALLVDRMLESGDAAGVAADGASEAGLWLLSLLEAAQTSRFRLEALLTTRPEIDAGAARLLVGFAALLLSQGLALPRREADTPLRRPDRGQTTLRSVETRHAV